MVSLLVAWAWGLGGRSHAHDVEQAEPAVEAEASENQIEDCRHEIRPMTDVSAGDRKVAARIHKGGAYLFFTAHVLAFGLLWNPIVWSFETPPWISAASFLTSWAGDPLGDAKKRWTKQQLVSAGRKSVAAGRVVAAE